MEKIIAATDFSPSADNAALYAAQFAQRVKASLVLVHAYTIPVGGYDVVMPVDVIGEIRNAAVSALGGLKKNLLAATGNSIEITTVVEAGSPIDVIKETADRMGADLVVTGLTGSAGALRKKLIGSNSLAAAHRVKVPLLVIPEGAEYSAIGNIAFACDTQNEKNAEILHIAKFYAMLLNAKLSVVEVIDAVTEKVTAGEREIKKTLENLNHHTVTIRHTDAVVALEDYLKGGETDLLILHPGKHNLFSRIFTPGTTSSLAWRVKVPLLLLT